MIKCSCIIVRDREGTSLSKIIETQRELFNSFKKPQRDRLFDESAAGLENLSSMSDYENI